MSQRNPGGWSNLCLAHCDQQRPYIDWKCQLLGDLCRNPARRPQRLWTAETVLHPVLDVLRRQSYQPHKNIGPWVDPIGALGLAIAYQDDGTLVNQRSPRLYLCDFDADSIDYLRELLWHRWGIRTSKTTMFGTDQFQLHILTPYERFWEVVAPYVHPSMAYKLPLEWRGRFAPAVCDSQRRELVYSRLVAVEQNPISPGRRGDIRTTWCIDVAETHNFFTLGEVAHNCRDADATLRVYRRML